MLFLLYINDLPEVVCNNTKVRMFVDDVKMYNLGPLSSDSLQLCFNKILEWQLPISENKTITLHIGKNNPRFSYHLGGLRIEGKDEVRDLGILIDKDLRFEKHITNITKRAFLRANHILKCFNSSKIEVYTKAFKTYVRPLLEYSTEVFGPCSKKMIRQMERPQRFFTRIAMKKCGIEKMNYRDRISTMYLESLELRRQKQQLKTVFKIMNNFVKVEKGRLFSFSTRTSSRTHHQKFFKKRVSSRSGNWFPNKIVSIWNSLPKGLDNASSVLTFKNLLDSIPESDLVPNSAIC